MTTIKFNETGDYLGVGDQGGRVIIFKRASLSKPYASQHSRYFDYRYMTEIQSHEPEFDCLKSREINEGINVIEFLKSKSSSTPNLELLSANDKIIKLWKVDYKQ